MQPQPWGYKTIRLPLTVVNGFLVAIVMLLIGLIALLIACKIQKNIIGNLDKQLSVAQAEAEEAAELNQTWKVHFQTWVNKAVEEELAKMATTPSKFPPPIAIPEEEDINAQEMIDDDIITTIIRDFGSTEESGPGQ